MLFHQDNVPCHKSIAKMVKLFELHFEVIVETEVEFWLKFVVLLVILRTY